MYIVLFYYYFLKKFISFSFFFLLSFLSHLFSLFPFFTFSILSLPTYPHQPPIPDVMETCPPLISSLIFYYFFLLPTLLSKNDNGTGSGRVALIPTPPYLFKIIPTPVPFKKLNGVGWGGYDKFSYPPRLTSCNFFFEF